MFINNTKPRLHLIPLSLVLLISCNLAVADDSVIDNTEAAIEATDSAEIRYIPLDSAGNAAIAAHIVLFTMRFMGMDADEALGEYDGKQQTSQQDCKTSGQIRFSEQNNLLSVNFDNCISQTKRKDHKHVRTLNGPMQLDCQQTDADGCNSGTVTYGVAPGTPNQPPKTFRNNEELIPLAKGAWCEIDWLVNQQTSNEDFTSNEVDALLSCRFSGLNNCQSGKVRLQTQQPLIRNTSGRYESGQLRLSNPQGQRAILVYQENGDLVVTQNEQTETLEWADLSKLCQPN